MPRSTPTRSKKAALSLRLSTQTFSTVFDVVGRQKNDMARAIGWTFSQCPEFLKHFVDWMMVFEDVSVGEVPIFLQMWERPNDFTTLEILGGERFHCFIHATHGSTFPRTKQLRDYASRLRRNGSDVKCLVVLTETALIDAWASRGPKFRDVRLSWSSCKIFGALAMQAACKTRTERLLWLEQLSEYIGPPTRPDKSTTSTLEL